LDGIPVSRLQEGEREKLVSSRIICTYESWARTKRSSRANAVRRAGPVYRSESTLGSLFSRTHCVAKRIGRALAEFLFDDENAMIRIDMSEYHGEDTVARLIGATTGLRRLTRKAANFRSRCAQAVSVVLFDKSKKRIRTCSTCCCKCSTTAASRTGREKR